MGSWQLEVFRMAVYISFPVGIFWLFNQPKYFEHLVIKKKAECFPPDNPETIKFFADLKNELRARQLAKES